MSDQAKPERATTWQRLLPFVAIPVFTLALWVIHRELTHFDLRAVMSSVKSMTTAQLVAAVFLTAVSYLILTCYDGLAIRYLGERLSYGRTALSSFTAYVLNMNIGVSVLGGTAVRARLYGGWGFTAVQIGKIVGFCALTSGIGIASAGGVLLISGQSPEGAESWIPQAWLRPLGAVMLVLVVAYLVLCFVFRGQLEVRSWRFELPRPAIAFGQLTVSVADLLAAGSVLYIILGAREISFPEFFAVYLFSIVVGLVSHVPGGLGVIESVFMLCLPTQMDHAELLGRLLAFRAVYYLMPLGIALCLIAVYEAKRVHRGFALPWNGLRTGVSAIAPRFLAISTFIGGVILVVSGATPSVEGRLRWLNAILPLPILEFSHFLGSVVGACLLFLARGLQRRLNAAWAMTVALLGAGVCFSLIKGLDYEEGIILGIMLIALVLSRREFYRKSSLLDQRFTAGWIAAICLVMAGTVWLGLFVFRHVDYSNDLWWKFALQGDAPRFLRATAGMIAVGVIISFARLLRSPVPVPARPTADDLETASRIASESEQTNAWLAMLGDKSLLFNPARNAFIMYGVSGRSWVSMGDPVGPASERLELAWQFRELCDLHGAWTVFYEITARDLPLYLELGLSVLKLGEEARVPLTTFSLEGGKRKSLRTTRSRLEREGCSFVVLSPGEVKHRMSELKAVSEDWLSRKNVSEKGFSMGRFDPVYLANFPAGAVFREGKLVAFANIWTSMEKHEMSVDLMRFSADAPPNVMEYLFIELLLHGAASGYAWFNLGMAPLSGIENHPLAPLWNRIGSMLFQHGEHFYNFKGLRAYKEKFDPVWEPRFLACPGGVILPRVLTNVATLVSGGVRRLVIKK